MRITVNRKQLYTQASLIGVAILSVAAIGIGGYLANQHTSKADYVPESCFMMDGGDPTKIVSYNVAADPLCLTDVTIPSTIAGNPVRILGSGIFWDDTITSVVIPDTVEEIESAAFSQAGTTLSDLTISVTGDLLIGSGAFGSGISGDVSIHADGNLAYNDSFSGATLDSLALSAGGSISLPTSTTPPTSIGALTLTAGGDITSSADSFSETTIASATLQAGGSVTLNSGAFASHIGAFSIDADQAVAVTASAYDTFNTLAIGSIDFTAGTSLTVASSALSNLNTTSTIVLTAGSGLLSITGGALCDVADVTTATITAPNGFTVSGGAFCDMPTLTTVNLPSLDGDVSIEGFNNIGISTFSIDTTGSATFTNSAFYGTTSLTDFIVEADGDVTVQNGTFSSHSGMLETISLAGDTVTITASAFNGLQSSNPLTFSVTSLGDILLDGGAMNSISAQTDLTMNAGNDLSVQNGAFGSFSGLQSVDLDAQNDLLIGNSGYFFSGSPDVTTITIEAGNDIISSTPSILYDLPSLDSLSITSGRDTLFQFQTISNLPALTALTFNVGRDFAINSASLSSIPNLSSLIIDTDGDITIGNGVAGSLTGLENATLTAAGTLSIGSSFLDGSYDLETLNLHGGSLLSMASSSITSPSTPSKFTNITLFSGSDLSIQNNFFNLLTETVSVHADGDVYMAGAFSSLPNLSDLTITSGGLVDLFASFNTTDLQTVTIDSATVVIDGTSFLLTGVKYDGATFTELDQLRFTPLTITNPGSLTDTIADPVDLDGDTVNDPTGGFLVNPAQLRIQLTNNTPGDLGTETDILGRQADGTPIHTYLVSENPTNDFDLYYHLGDSVTLTAPALAGFATPAAQTVVLDAGLNTVNFVYFSTSAPNTGILGAESTPKTYSSAYAVTSMALGAVAALLIGGGIAVALRVRSNKQ